MAIFNVTSLMGCGLVNLLSISVILNLCFESFFTNYFIWITVIMMSSTSRKTHFPLTMSLILNVTSFFSLRIRSIAFLYSSSSLSIVYLIVSFAFFYKISFLPKSIFYLMRIIAFLFGWSGLSFRPTLVWMASLKHAYLMSSSKFSWFFLATVALYKIIFSSWACLSSSSLSIDGLWINSFLYSSFYKAFSRYFFSFSKPDPGGYSLLIHLSASSIFYSIWLTDILASSRHLHALTK